MKKIVLIALLLLINISCSNHNRLIKEENRIKKFITNQKTESFHLILDTISSFEWNKLLIVGPYVDLDRVSNYNLDKIPKTIKDHDNFILFSFINKDEGTKYMEFERKLLPDHLFESQTNDYKIYPKSKSKWIIKNKNSVPTNP